MNEHEYIRKALSGLHASENTLEEVMKKADERKTHGKVCYVRKSVLIAAVLVILCFTVACAAVVIEWGGFSFIEGLSNAEKNELIQSGSTSIAGGFTDAKGFVHYLDENGEEIMVLSPEEAEEYDRKRIEAKNQTVIDSIARVDASTIIPLIPGSITEVGVQTDGHFADFALGNGHMVLLYPEDEDGYNLKRGDVVTITLELNEAGTLQFAQFKDGVFVDGSTISAQSHQYSFSVEEDGQYCFCIMYYSAAVGLFANGTLTID